MPRPMHVSRWRLASSVMRIRGQPLGKPCIRTSGSCVQRHEAAPVGAARLTEEAP